jgi:hypothetical protein
MSILYQLFGSPILSLFFSIISTVFLGLILLHVVQLERKQVGGILFVYISIWFTASFIYRDTLSMRLN